MSWYTEPEFKCPECQAQLHTAWVDIGFGPYSQQVSPYACECGWIEQGCPQEKCSGKQCYSWETCQGRAI